MINHITQCENKAIPERKEHVYVTKECNQSQWGGDF